jgi:hypothetical protein
MQRSALVPLAQHIRDMGLDPGSMRVMEACCGTGRFHTFLKVWYRKHYILYSTKCCTLSAVIHLGCGGKTDDLQLAHGSFRPAV